MKLASPFSQVARQLIANGISVIPIKPNDKCPGRWTGDHWQGLEKWSRFSKKFPEECHLKKWETYPDAGIGILLGKLSGIIAIDFDDHPEAWRSVERIIPNSPVKKKGKKGYTAFYRYDGEKNDKWVHKDGTTVIDLLSDGRQTVIPPSIHPCGDPYQWLTEQNLWIPNITKELPYFHALEGTDEALLGHSVYSPRSRSQVCSPLSGLEPCDGDFEIEDAKAALKTISPDCDNDTWVKIGMGLKEAFGDEGLSVWDSWSAGGEKYKPGEPEKRWSSFKNHGVTLKFMFRQAADAGYKREVDVVGLNTPEDADFESLWPDEDKIEMTPLTEEEKEAGKVLPQKSKVVNIQSRRPVDQSELEQLLAAIPENCSEVELPSFLEPVFSLTAESNGTTDVAVVNQIASLWDFVKSEHKRAFQKRIKEIRKETKRGKEPETVSDEDGPRLARRPQYFALFDVLDRIKDPMMCILTEELTYSKGPEETRCKAVNILREVKSDITDYQERNKELKFLDSKVEQHFYAWASTFKPRLCVNIPKWDGVDRIQELADLITLDDEFSSSSGITHEFFTEFLKDWVSRKWIKLYYPMDMDAQNRLFLLVGAQGQGKDKWIEHLVGGLGQYAPFMTISAKNDKDNKTQLHSGVVLNISEFDKTAVMETAALKAIITECSTNVRKSYDRSEEYRYVRSSLISTCNKPVHELLKDWTGNRRFLPFTISKVEWITTDKKYRRQVLAQGRELAKNRTFASKEAEELMAAYQRRLTPESPDEEIRESFDDLMEMHCRQLRDAGKLEKVNEWYRAGNDKFRGYCPNSHLNELGVFDALTRQTKYQGRKIKGALQHSRSHRNEKGDIIPKKIGGVSCRGLYFQPIQPGDYIEEREDDDSVPF